MNGWRISSSHVTHLFAECVAAGTHLEQLHLVETFDGEFRALVPNARHRGVSSLMTLQFCRRCLARRAAVR